MRPVFLIVPFFLSALPLMAGMPDLSPATETGHGGGCRKSSPPGHCYHMDNSVGQVHCH